MNGNIQFKIDDTFTLLHDMGVLCKLGNNPQPIYFYKNTVNTGCAKSDLVKIQILLKNKKLAFIQKLDNVQDAISVYQAVVHYDNLYRLVMESSKEGGILYFLHVLTVLQIKIKNWTTMQHNHFMKYQLIY